MNYQEAREYIEKASCYGSVLGLENIKELLLRLGNPQDDVRFIHIAGTNGKGSVLAYLSTILMDAGFRVGRYISPTLFSYRERIQVNEEKIAKNAFAAHMSLIADTIAEMQNENLPHPTPFEIETALCFLYFKEMKCDFVVLETGLGGLEDATNVVKTSIVEVITPISMDHMGFLGNTLREIAYNKAGIIKPGTTVVSAPQKPEAMAEIEKKCAENKCKLRIVNDTCIDKVTSKLTEQRFSYQTQGNHYEDMAIHLLGSYQIQNAALALETIEALRELNIEISPQAVRSGMERTQWRGRFTIINQNPMVIIDGAHNEDAARTLKESIELYFPNKTRYFIMGMFADKECEKVAALTANLAESITTITIPQNDRAIQAAELSQIVKPYNTNVRPANSIEEAIEQTLKKAKEEDVVIAFGSLSFLGIFEHAVHEYYHRDTAKL